MRLDKGLNLCYNIIVLFHYFNRGSCMRERGYYKGVCLCCGEHTEIFAWRGSKFGLCRECQKNRGKYEEKEKERKKGQKVLQFSLA